MIKPANENEVKLEIKQFPFTNVGRELSGVQNALTPESRYKAFAKELAKNKQIVVEMHQVISVQGEQIRYNPANMIEEADLR